MNYDTKLRKKLIRKIKVKKIFNKNVLISLEDFFTGNNDIGSIGCNLMEHPGIDVFSNTLFKLREHKDVSSILVEINDIEKDCWPYSDTVYITTCLDDAYIDDYLKMLKYDELLTKADDVCQLSAPMSYKTIAVWWD